jgi:uncharacterized protein (TIGR02679 family)
VTATELLEDAGWHRLLAASRRRLERTGGRITGTVGLKNPTDAERRVVIGITGRYRGFDVATVRIDLAEIDQALLDRYDAGLLAVLATLHGPVRDRAAEKADEQVRKADALAEARRRGRSQAGEPWFRQWLEHIASDGTLTRLVRRGDDDQLAWAAEVLHRLPADGIPLPMLAEWVTGNTKALSGTPLATLVLRAWALHDDVPAPTDRASQRRLWESAGAIVDDLASQVLVLGLRATEDHVVAEWLRNSAEFGIPFRLTLHQLTTVPVTAVADDIYVCENPAVLRAAVDEIDSSHLALVCSEGQPSAALHQLLAPAHGRIHWRGDFDWTGLRTTAMAIERYGASPWRMSTTDYLESVSTGDSEPLKGSPAPSPWDPALADAMRTHGRAVMEERLIPSLLADLRLNPNRG